MAQALYRKYRPRSFSDAVGQEAVTTTLKQAVKSGRISHAYLFAGPRGVGKTSVARILAHEVNSLPYSHDTVHLDIIEIDAASNRRIDEIRDLREKVHITPASSKYKVYIIDEVHMLTKEAFNALLKTLEEPPVHCIFILATTEAHKLPETIISRTQRFNFKPITAEATRGHLHKIAKSEKIDIEKDALDLLAGHGEGSLRDIIGLLDQLGSSGKKITVNDVRNLIGIPPATAIQELSGALTNKDSKQALLILEKLREQGTSPAVAAKSLSQNLRQLYLTHGASSAWLSGVLKNLLEVSSSSHPQEILELAVLEASSSNTGASTFEATISEPQPKPKNVAAVIENPNQQTTAKLKKDTSKPTPRPGGFSLDQWAEVLSTIQATSPSLYAALRLSRPSLDDNRLKLAFPFPLHQKKAKEARHIKVLSDLIEDISGDKLSIDCLVDKEINGGGQEIPVTDVDNAAADHELQAISNIFGSAEVLES